MNYIRESLAQLFGAKPTRVAKGSLYTPGSGNSFL